MLRTFYTIVTLVMLAIANVAGAQDTTAIKALTARTKSDMDSVLSSNHISTTQVAKNNRAETRVRARQDSIVTAMRVPGTPPVPSGIVINPGTNIQTVVNANPAGTAFILAAGTHVQQSVVPKEGDTFRGEVGTILDGQNTTQYAFYGWNGSAWINNVTIRNMKITKYNPPAQRGAISSSADDITQLSSGWLLDSLEVNANANMGVRVGSRMRVLRSNLHHNGTINIGGVGVSVVVDGITSAFGNNGCVNNPGFESGGSKFVLTDSLVVRNSTFSDNCGVGLWLDINNDHYQLYGNTVERNYREGICVEISFAGKIYNNIVNANGWPTDAFRPNGWLWDAGIGVHESRDVEVYGNTLVDNFQGIVIIQQKRDSSTGDTFAPTGGYIAQNVYVHNNTITQRQFGGVNGGDGSAAAGGANDAGDTSTFLTRNNRFVANNYYTGSNTYAWAWMNGFRNATQWKSYGFDASGTFNP